MELQDKEKKINRRRWEEHYKKGDSRADDDPEHNRGCDLRQCE